VGTQYQLLTLFADGGWMMYPLVLCSLIALGVILAKGWTLHQAHHGTRRVLAAVEEAALSGNLDEALRIATETPGPAAAILVVGFRRIARKRVAEGEVDKAIATTGAIELGFLERGLVILATIANVAPLMGFLGTVAGMIETFQSMMLFGAGDPKIVSGGISLALVATELGLVVAIPILLLHGWLHGVSNQIIHLLEEEIAVIVARREEQIHGAGAAHV